MSEQASTTVFVDIEKSVRQGLGVSVHTPDGRQARWQGHWDERTGYEGLTNFLKFALIAATEHKGRLPLIQFECAQNLPVGSLTTRFSRFEQTFGRWLLKVLPERVLDADLKITFSLIPLAERRLARRTNRQSDANLSRVRRKVLSSFSVAH